MLSVAPVRSASGAAGYFAADNYYAGSDAEQSGEWVGDGAAALGLDSPVDAAAFEALLSGELPNGERVGTPERHRAGLDLTFSLPKSWSLLALVAGDRRIVAAYKASVKETLAWTEKNAAEARIEKDGKSRIVPTGNLTIGLFEHDTNRNQEPDLHFHAVIANVTKDLDGKWRALRNDKLWSLNTLFNAMTMASFRTRVEALGYQPGPADKHGNFEARGVSRGTIMAFSTRRQEVLDARRGPGLGAGIVATLATREPKAPVDDRDALVESWRTRADDIGAGLDGVRNDAEQRVIRGATGWGRVVDSFKGVAARGRALADAFRERLEGPETDPLIPKRAYLKSISELASIHSVASAVRHLSQREAAFETTDIYKVTLGFGLPVEMPAIEKRVAQLRKTGVLIQGKGQNAGLMTTQQAIASEARILAEVDAGKGQVDPILPADVAGERLQRLAEIKHGFRLNSGQEQAGRMLLSSRDRIVAVQGVAGAGKSTMLKPAAEILREEGRNVLGLAIQNTLVQMLERDTGIPSVTVAKFLYTHRELLEPEPSQEKVEHARSMFEGSVLLLDEASMVPNGDQEKLTRLANLLGVARFANIGDRKQLAAVDAGKPFDIMQGAGTETALMHQNIRARTPELRAAQAAAQGGRIERAMHLLKPNIVEAENDGAIVAAERWLSLSPEDRARTSIYASGRKLRGEVNEAVQIGLIANGELGPGKVALSVHDRVNTTSEEMRYARTYRKGMVLNVARRIDGQKFPRGQYEIAKVDQEKSVVVLADEKGRERKLKPGRLRTGKALDGLSLFERKSLDIHEGDRIRWTDTDRKRGLLNADQATVMKIDDTAVKIKTAMGVTVSLSLGDPMLKRLDLAYALNAHMAQGLTSDRGIAVMDSRERNLSNKQTFLVTITRLRDKMTLVVDRADPLQRVVGRNEGSKMSALEAAGRLKAAAAASSKIKHGPMPGGDTDNSMSKPELEKQLVYEIGI